MFDESIEPAGPKFGRGKSTSPEERLYPGSTNTLPASNAPKEQSLGFNLVQLHQTLMAYYQRELQRQAENRAEMAEDEAIYDNEQWTAEEKQILADRGQEPLVYNVTSTTINWLLGTEKRSRTDFRVLPRRKDAAIPAERKTQIIKYLNDINKTQYHRSRAFEDTVKAGIGWLEDGIQSSDDGEPLYSRFESWRNMLWDSACTEMDLSDGRYVIRTKWIDEDIGKAMFPGKTFDVSQACRSAGAYDFDLFMGDDAMDAREDAMEEGVVDVEGNNRRRFKAMEVWFRAPRKVNRMRGGEFNGEVFDKDFQPHADALTDGTSFLIERTMTQMFVAIITSVSVLYVGPSPYRHNRFPFSPIWCYRRSRDGLPYGVIRGMKGIQRDINKRASKALAILSSNKTIMEEGAVPDLDEFAEEISRPDAIIVKKAGKELVINADRELAPAHLDLMSRSISMIQQQSGVTDENLGRSSNATSGLAIGRRQEQGALATAGIFDNLRYAAQTQGEKQLANIEQHMPDHKQFRITNMRGTPEYITVNDGLPENDIIRTKADFIISEQDWRASVRQAQTQELLDLLSQLAPVNPQVAMAMLDLVIEGMDIPQRDELVRRIRQITGMRDPDAEQPTQEEMAQAKAQAQDKAKQDALLDATIADKMATAKQKEAAAEKIMAEAQRALAAIAQGNVAASRAAIDTATAMLLNPAAVEIADEILHEARFQSRTEMEEGARQSGIVAGEAQQASEQQAAEQQAMEQQQLVAEQQQQPPQQDAPPPDGSAPTELPAFEQRSTGEEA